MLSVSECDEAITETRADGGGNMRPRLLSRSMEFRAILSSAHTTRRAVRPVTCVARRGALATAKAALAERRQAIVRRNAIPFVPQARDTSKFFLIRERDVRVRQWQAPPARRSKAHLKYFFGETKTLPVFPRKATTSTTRARTMAEAFAVPPAGSPAPSPSDLAYASMEYEWQRAMVRARVI